MRSILNGTVSLGLVNVPVKVYAATEDHDIKFHQVHAVNSTAGNPAICGQVRYKKTCEQCGEVVDNGDIARAFTEDDQTVVITDDDTASLSQDRPIEVLEFVPADGVDPLMYDKAYYLGPDVGKGKTPKAYTLLTQVLKATEQTAIVQFTLRSKTRLAALRVMSGKQDILVLHTLQWPDEVREAEFPVLDNPPEVSNLEVEAGKQLVLSLSAAGFNPDNYRDTYQEQLRELIDAKLAGDVPVTPGVVEAVPDDVSDLLAKLQASMRK